MHHVQIGFISEMQVRFNTLESITNSVHKQTRMETTCTAKSQDMQEQP